MSLSVSHLVVFSQLNVRVLDSRRLSIPNRNRLRSRADREDCPSVHLRCSAGLGSCIQPRPTPNALGRSVCFCPLLFSPSKSCLLPIFLPHSTINSFIPFASQTGVRTGCPQKLCPWYISPSHATPSGYLFALHRSSRWSGTVWTVGGRQASSSQIIGKLMDQTLLFLCITTIFRFHGAPASAGC